MEPQEFGFNGTWKQKPTKSVISDVVSKPAVRPSVSVASEKPEQRTEKPGHPKVEEKRFTIEPLPSHESIPNADQVNSQALQHLTLMKHFGIEGKPTPDEINKLKTVWEFVRKETVSETLAAVIRLRNRLGTTNYGESPLDRVYRHIQIRRIKEYEKV